MDPEITSIHRKDQRKGKRKSSIQNISHSPLVSITMYKRMQHSLEGMADQEDARERFERYISMSTGV